MRHILGHLNQNEWILGLNIGDVIQIQPIRIKDLMISQRNEDQLSRDSFLEKIQLLIVSYFCVSTEFRFLNTSSGQPNEQQNLEQEYWHKKALEIACTFLPGECPLVKHI